jgi:ABC-type glycerol-3-phosphate transport system substrate-binding protein
MKKFKWVAVLLMVCACCLPIMANGTAEESGKQKLVVWDKAEYVEAYNKLSKQRLEEFGKQNNVEIEYIIVPTNDLKQKLLAAIEAKNQPDLVVIDDYAGKQFAGMNQLADVSSVLKNVNFTEAGLNVSKCTNGNYLVPMCILAPGAYLRKDVFEKHNLALPKTWDELKADAKIINDPQHDFYALGLPMGISGGGDAEGFCRSVILSYGGVPIDANGKVTVNSPETKAALEFMASLYKEKLCPPSAITWDDMGNNTAYLAGSVGYIQNSGSVFTQLKKENPELYAKTAITGYMAGPKGTYTLAGGNCFMIFKNPGHEDLAKKYIEYFFQKDFYSSFVTEMGGMWQPVVVGAEENDFWKKEENKGWLLSSQNAYPNIYPAPATDLVVKCFSEQLCVKAVQKIVLNNMPVQDALDDLEKEFNRVLGNK